MTRRGTPSAATTGAWSCTRRDAGPGPRQARSRTTTAAGIGSTPALGTIVLGTSTTPVKEHPRVHLDLYADDAAEQVERPVAPGAGRVDWDRCPPEPDLVVPAGTEGNRLHVVDESFG
ncbi:VOC family protein [Actinacidiphila glaucinigra]|uniref:VOC family protein n=1 Tax=Actinacidiphila glaucinigra TaxID=235986 RepID=UPI0036B90306